VNEEFVFINDVPEENRIRGDLPPTKKEDCEVTLLLFCVKLLLSLLLINLFIARLTTSWNGQALQSIKSLRRIKMSVKILSLEATFKTVLDGG